MPFENLNDDQVPPSDELFLDTSIHCSKLKGPLFRQRISDVFRLFRWKGTSTYTKVEFGNVVLSVAEYFLRKLDEFDSLEATQDFIGNVLPHNLHPTKVTWSFNLLKAFGADDAECTERARLSLRRLMKLGVTFVEKSCDRPLANGTDCYWAKRGVHRRRDGRLVWQTPICKRAHKRCRLDDFFVEKRDVFRRIKDAIDKLPEDAKSDQLRDFFEVIGLAMEDPKMLLDYRAGCKRLADGIIAVDSVAYKSVFSQNIKESELLTTVLGQAFYYLPANPERGVLVQLAVPEQASARV
ncbi:MAG: hypothetical protein R6U98_03135 [Pirellulaceae bacterium]